MSDLLPAFLLGAGGMVSIVLFLLAIRILRVDPEVWMKRGRIVSKAILEPAGKYIDE